MIAIKYTSQVRVYFAQHPGLRETAEDAIARHASIRPRSPKDELHSITLRKHYAGGRNAYIVRFYTTDGSWRALYYDWDEEDSVVVFKVAERGEDPYEDSH